MYIIPNWAAPSAEMDGAWVVSIHKSSFGGGGENEKWRLHVLNFEALLRLEQTWTQCWILKRVLIAAKINHRFQNQFCNSIFVALSCIKTFSEENSIERMSLVFLFPWRNMQERKILSQIFMRWSRGKRCLGKPAAAVRDIVTQLSDATGGNISLLP